MSLREKIRALFRLFMLFTVLVAAALISAITTLRLTIRGHQETMPSLVGVPLEAAQRRASDLGLELKLVDRLYNSQYAANQVLSQEPPAGTPIKVGQHIHVLVSLGPQLVAVPNLIGRSLRAAQIAVVQRGLTVGNVAGLHNLGTEPDQVLAQDPSPSTTSARSPAVDFLVSLGEPPPAYVCPRFLGQRLADAQRAIEKSGFRVGKVTPVPADGTAPGTILRQTPRPGSRIGPDTIFDFQVTE